MTDSATVALIIAFASLIAALVSGGIALWNRRKTDKNSEDIQSLKGAIERDIERLRAKLAHVQTVSATQWNAEFAAYQAIWESIVDVRPIADKLVNREEELNQIGLPEKYLNNEARLQHRRDLTQQLVDAAKGLLSAIHDNAPFYPAEIRDVANEAHKTTIQLVSKNLCVMTEALKGSNVLRTDDFRLESIALLLDLIDRTDKVESLIRKRLEAVQVVAPVAV